MCTPCTLTFHPSRRPNSLNGWRGGTQRKVFLVPPVARNPLSIHEVALVVAIFAGWFIFSSVQAVLADFPVPRLSDKDALVLIVLECLTFPVAMSVLWVRGWRRRDFGIQISWVSSFAGVLLFCGAVIVEIALADVFAHFFGGREFLDEFARAVSLSIPMAILVSIVNGCFEEFFLCRYLVEAFARFGPQVALGVSALIRVMYHLYQGPLGAALVMVVGVVFSLFYWRFRQIWPVMVAHMMVDVVALT